jgi:predicted Zn-ribbon and HTH transcriptional regulator
MIEASFEVILPNTCKKCGFNNFNLWGTILNDKFNAEWRCMCCGNKRIIHSEH